MRVRGARWPTLLAACLAFFVILLDTSIVNLALVRMQEELHTNLGGIQWVVDGYALVFASLLLTGGTLADTWGAQPVFLFGISLFTLASGLCGLAPNLDWLLAGRALQGIGAAVLLPGSLTLLRAAYPDVGERARAVGLWIAAGGVANAAGPTVGGLLITAFSWRAIFLVNLPIGAGLAWLAARHVLRPAANGGGHLDLQGQVLAIIALGLFTWTIIEGPDLGWTSLWIIGALVVAIISALAFIKVEGRASEPMLPLDLFKGGVTVEVSLIAVLHNFGIYGQLFAAGLFLQRVLGFTPLLAGLAFLPMTAAIAIFAFISGRWIAKSGPYAPLNTGHALAAAGSIGIAGLIASGHSANTPLLLLCLTAVGMGAGFAAPPMTTVFLSSLPSERSGLAGGVLNTSRQIGNVLGIAALGTIITAFGGSATASGYVASWMLAAAVLATNVVLGLSVAYRQRAIVPATACDADVHQ